jgi:hypothetical protein
MANLIQADYDALAPQLVTKKRTAGANSGKTIREIEYSRGLYDHLGSPNVAGANVAGVRIVYTDGTQEVLVHGADVVLYVPGHH